MNNFNLTEWALKHKQIIYFFIAVIFIGGAFMYPRLGRMEDPDFTVRTMVIAVAWPGASARQVEEQVTDKIERKLQETPGLDYLKSFSTPGQCVIYVYLKEETVPGDKVRPLWLEVRNLVTGMWGTLPQGVAGPFINDRYDDVFGNVYALTGDGFSYEQMRQEAEKIRRVILRVPSINKVELLGVQPEKLAVEMEPAKLAQLGIDPALIARTIQGQNAMTPSGMIETRSDRVFFRINGMLDCVEDIKNTPINAAGRTFRLGDIATIKREYADPPEPRMFFNGKPAIGIAASMEKGGNILNLGTDLQETIKQVSKNLPLGLEINIISNQPKVVKEAINEFIRVLGESVLIVLIVCFLSLGMRSGMVVALCIPLVIAVVFIVMRLIGIDLHKISLGALIVALGLLVDDAIIAIEMMTVKLEQGWQRFDAASYAYKATAYPRLTGALVTCAGFIPLAFSKGAAAEFVGSLFSVVTIALLISWLVAGTATPMIGSLLVQPKLHQEGHDIYNTPFYRWFKRLLTWCLVNRWKVIAATAISFVIAVGMMVIIKTEYFPQSTRPELIVDLRLPQGASIRATELEANRFAKHLANDPDIEQYSYYIGQGAPRFILTLDPTLPDSSLAQFIIVARDYEARKRLLPKLHKLFNTEFSNMRCNTKPIVMGPPQPYPVMLRVTGTEHDEVRRIAEQSLSILSKDKNLTDIHMDWNEKNKVMRLEIDQDKIRALGLDNRTLAMNLQTLLSGMPIGEYRENDRTIDILFRVDPRNREDLSKIKNLNIHIGGGRFVPVAQLARISYEAEEGLIWRRHLQPTITLQANTASGITGTDATARAYDELSLLRKSLPSGYRIEIGGTLEDSNKGTGNMMAVVPVMLVTIMILLMFQLQSISKMTLTLLTAPMGLIGASLALLLTGRPMGFVVQVGILALAGIIMRNSVILIDQIDQQLAAGQSTWNAIINATVLRFRPIMLTAAAAILAMIPISMSAFWGPMAVAIGGGLFGATILTLVVLPAMYTAWYKVKPEEKDL